MGGAGGADFSDTTLVLFQTVIALPETYTDAKNIHNRLLLEKMLSHSNTNTAQLMDPRALLY